MRRVGDDYIKQYCTVNDYKKNANFFKIAQLQSIWKCDSTWVENLLKVGNDRVEINWVENDRMRIDWDGN